MNLWTPWAQFKVNVTPFVTDFELKKKKKGVTLTLNLCHWIWTAGPRSAVGNVSGYRCVSDCRSRGRKFDPGTVPYFRGDWSWNYFYGHSPPFRWFIQEGLLSVTSESMCTNYWLTACSSLPRTSVVRWTDRPAMTIAVDLGCKATLQTNTKLTLNWIFSWVWMLKNTYNLACIPYHLWMTIFTDFRYIFS